MSLVERNREESELALSAQVSLLEVFRSSLYYHKAEPSEWEIELKRRIDLIYTDYPFLQLMAHYLSTRPEWFCS